MRTTATLATALALTALALSPAAVAAGPAAAQAMDESAPSTASILAGLELRAIGPALMGGPHRGHRRRPRRTDTWYVAVGSGGVWKTVNAGATWHADLRQPAPLDRRRLPRPVEPVDRLGRHRREFSGRHVGWGDGVYKCHRRRKSSRTWASTLQSTSARSWSARTTATPCTSPPRGRCGPRAASVASTRPPTAARPGGGARRSTTTPASTDLEFDPRDPDVLYAAAYQRRRHVWSLIDGGPGSGIYKSTDGGRDAGGARDRAPHGAMGKIGLAVSPADPDVVYATIEAERRERGFYRSPTAARAGRSERLRLERHRPPLLPGDRGFAARRGRVYQMDVWLKRHRRRRQRFDILGTGPQAQRQPRPRASTRRTRTHLIVGWTRPVRDLRRGTTWRQFPNLPVPQFYKLRSTRRALLPRGRRHPGHGHPARTAPPTIEGIRNADWTIPLGADGYDCNFDPEEPTSSTWSGRAGASSLRPEEPRDDRHPAHAGAR